VGFSRRNKIPHCSAYDSKPRVAAATGAQYGFFCRVIKFCFAVHTLWEKAIWLRHPDYDTDPAQKLISSSKMMSSKSMHTFLSNLANRQTDRQTLREIVFTSSVVGGKLRCIIAIYIPTCELWLNLGKLEPSFSGSLQLPYVKC